MAEAGSIECKSETDTPVTDEDEIRRRRKISEIAIWKLQYEHDKNKLRMQCIEWINIMKFSQKDVEKYMNKAKRSKFKI